MPACPANAVHATLGLRPLFTRCLDACPSPARSQGVPVPWLLLFPTKSADFAGPYNGNRGSSPVPAPWANRPHVRQRPSMLRWVACSLFARCLDACPSPARSQGVPVPWLLLLPTKSADFAGPYNRNRGSSPVPAPWANRPHVRLSMLCGGTTLLRIAGKRSWPFRYLPPAA